jgi:hypothetical protein
MTVQVYPQIEDVNVADCIHVYRNALSDELCDDIWNFYYANFDVTSPGKTVGGMQPDIKKTRDFYDTETLFADEETKNRYNFLDNKIYEGIRNATRLYIDKYDWLKNCPNLIDTGYLWQGYKKGEGYYHEHIDGENWSPSARERVMAIVAYINTVEHGGETYFRHQGVSVKPEKGAVCVFPAHWSYPHQAMMPVSSDKLIISSFVVTPQ